MPYIFKIKPYLKIIYIKHSKQHIYETINISSNIYAWKIYYTYLLIIKHYEKHFYCYVLPNDLFNLKSTNLTDSQTPNSIFKRVGSG